MRNYSVFDILGPIMIGPSSSHTAGAARLAKIAASIAGFNEIKEVKFLLHGSFAKTYRGHGTDRALVGGILGMDPWDKGIRDSFQYAEEKGLKYEFVEADLGDVHPNTIKIVITKITGKVVEVTGSSIGGGNIKVFNIDGQPVDFSGDYTTIIITHNDKPGMISKISTLLYKNDINIAFMNVFRNSRGLRAVMVCQVDALVPDSVITQMKELEDVISIQHLKPLKEGE